MVIAHLADLHIGYSHLNRKAEDGRNQRLVDFEKAALTLAEEAVRRQPDIAVVAGDLFHKINMFPSALSGAVSFVNIFASAGIPLLVIGGNHDEAETEGGYNGLQFLNDHTDVNLFLEQNFYDTDEARFHLVSYRVLSRSENGGPAVQPFKYADDRANILITHGYVSKGVDDIMAESETVIPNTWLDDPRFDLKLLGHIHHRHEARRAAFYPGSVERRNFGESGETPGFYMHEISKDSVEGEIINTNGEYNIATNSVLLENVSPDLPRPMIDKQFDLKEMRIEDLNQEVIRIIETAPEGAMVRIVLDNSPAALDRNQFRSNWETLARKKRLLFFEATVRSKEMSELMDIHFVGAPKDVAKGLVDYVVAQEIIENKEEIVALTKETITEATEKILQAGEDS